MKSHFNNLLVSSPNGGGLSFLHEGKVIKLDGLDTTGIFYSPGLFLRGYQPDSMVISDKSEFVNARNSVHLNDIHDVLAYEKSVYVCATANNKISKIDFNGNEIESWQFPGEDDAWHINCLAVWNGRIVFSAFGEFAENRGYKGKTLKSGFVRDLHSGEQLISGLSQPHSLVTSGNNLLLANSEQMEIMEFSPKAELLRQKRLDGYTRGICVFENVIYVGLSRSRNVEYNAVSTSAVVALDKETLQEIGRIYLPCNEIYDLQMINDMSELIHIIATQASLSADKSETTVRALRSQVFQLRQVDAERESKISSLKQVVADREGQITSLNAKVAESDVRLADNIKALSERDKQITSLNETISIRDNQSAVLANALTESENSAANLYVTLSKRDRQIAILEDKVARRDKDILKHKQSVTDRNDEIFSLSQKIAETDGVNSSLNKSISEYKVAIDNLKKSVDEHDKKIANLKQAIIEKDKLLKSGSKKVALIQKQLNESVTRIHGIERSRSWRFTAPYRWVGMIIKKPFRQIAATGLLSRLSVATLLLPAALVYYGGLRGLRREMRNGRGLFEKVIDEQKVVRERLLTANRFFRQFVFLLFSLAIRIQRAGSVKRSFENFLRIIRKEGITGLRRRAMTTVPGSGYVQKPTDLARFENLPVLKKEVAKRILVADYRIPREDVSAGERATVGILRDLCELGFEVVFLPNDMLPSERYSAHLITLGIKVVTRNSGFNYSAQFLRQHGSEFGIFYFIRVDVAESLLPIARQVAPDSRVIFHAPDLYFLREMREAELSNDPEVHQRAVQTRNREVAMMSQSDRVVVVSPAEIPVLREVLPNTPISLFPVLYALVVLNPRPYWKRKNIFFLGGFGHTPNVDAVRWFATEVWPHIHKMLPKVEFRIVGAEAPESVLELGKLPGIKVIGYVPDLEPILKTMRVGVAPLRYGAGIKGKVAVTMGAGIPCVCTEIAAEGMGIKNNVHALVEDDPLGFADAVISLYKDREQWNRLAKNGQTLVQKCFGDAANRASLLKVLDDAQALPISLYCDYCKLVETVPVPDPDEQTPVEVSIIIPVYNKWNLTRSCLTSVIQTSVGNGVTYEIILADDGSSDDTVNAAQLFPGLRVVKTPSNLGFLRNCNNAAKYARGRHILLLNNDTVVLPGWLEALYQTMEQDPTIAIVGSKLLYPDGHIQEAGGGLLSNAEGVSIGRWMWVGEKNFPVMRREPIFNIRRETDYLSGASILVRKSFWDAVGGFDERYINAYCEDSDLAMTARSKGMRVVYDPKSEVIHFEHQTYAEEDSADHSHLQEQNKARLINKWRDSFKNNHLPHGSKWYQVAAHGERTIPAAVTERRKSGHLNILYFSPFPSHPGNHGNQSTIQQFARRFQMMGHKVHFALLRSAMYSSMDEEAMRDAWDSLDILPNTHPLGSNGKEIPYDGWYEEGLGENIRVLCEKYDIDIVFCSYIFQSKMLEYIPDYILKVIDTHDKMGNRYEMLRTNGQPLEFFSCTPEEEGAYLRRADVVVARREEEARYFDSVTGENSAIVIPHVEEPQFIQREFEVLRNVGIVASANRINLAIVRDCLESIERRLEGKPCPFTVNIAGQVKDMAEALPTKEREVFSRVWIRMHGYVPDISDFYNEMDLVLSPVTMGTGINVKTVQALAYGMPLITTICGSKGIRTGEPLHEHADLDQLVSSIFTLLQNPQELNRLAELSRSRYTSFYEEALSGFSMILNHVHLLGKSDVVGEVDVTYNPVRAKKDDSNLKDILFKCVFSYYRNGDRSCCLSDNDASKVRMDGSGAAAYINKKIEEKKVHDKDYNIFNIFNNTKSLILDIGANWGYSVASIWAVAPKCKIISFEPIVSYEGGFQVIKKQYPDKYDYRMVGLGNSSEVIKFVVPVINGVAISALATASIPVYDAHIDIFVKNIHNHIRQWMPEVDEIEFSLFEFNALIRKLDDVMEESPVLTHNKELVALKIDAEGYEADVLFGAESNLRKYKPLVMLEGGNRHKDLPDYMERLGYIYAERFGSLLRPIEGIGNSCNGFFIHKDNLPIYIEKGILQIDDSKDYALSLINR